MSYQIAKGVFDILPEESDPEGIWRESYRWQFVEECARKIAREYGFREIRTPLFENTALFERSIGKGTDIVSKEMYTFRDRADRSITLRPEGTAPVMRAFIEKHLDQRGSINKFYYLFPMFRYERNQAGRYRQHHQFGVEAIGATSPLQDAEVIDLLFNFYKRLGLKNLNLQINSIGDEETRKIYREALKKYLHPFFNELSEESRERYTTNPLRILDSKHPHDKKILKEAPSIIDFLDSSSKDHFERLISYLDLLGIPYAINPSLVRGLDYYTKTVFEITTDVLGSQNALGGGGRYDGLIKELGGPDLPAFGFGTGIERIIQTMIAQNAPFPEKPFAEIYIVPLSELAEKSALRLGSDLRKEGISSEIDFSGKKLKNALKYADQKRARLVAIIGDDELKDSVITLKVMATGEEKKIGQGEFVEQVIHRKMF